MSREKQLFLAIDQSTSTTKAILFTYSGKVIDQISLSHQQIYPKPGWVEHDANEIYQNTLLAIEGLYSRNIDNWVNVSSVSITNQRETFVVFEKRTGKPLYNAIVWQCRRGNEICNQLSGSDHEGLIKQRTGLMIDTYFPAPKMKWLFESRPDILSKVIHGEALIGTIDSYLIYRLTEGEVFATDHSNASRTLLYDITQLDWDEELANLFDVPITALPEIRSCNANFGITGFAGKLPSSLPIYGVMGDSQAALFAQRCFTPGKTKVTFGTGSSILLNCGNTPQFFAKGIVTTIAWVINGTPTYALEGLANFTGATIQWLRDQLQIIDSVDETESLATSVENNDGVYLLPAFVGMGTPYWRSDARAAILGLTPNANRAHIVRAALESIAYSINDILEHMKFESGVNLSEIFVDGGATRNKFLMQFVSDITRMRVNVSETPELSALGAVFAGMIGSGVVSLINDLASINLRSHSYTPQISMEKREEWVQGWKQAVRTILK